MAYENDVLTRNENDELAVRTVQSTGDNPASSYDDVFTRDDNGKLAVRTVGNGGGGGGAVSSVNGKTGAVVLNAEDVDAIPQVSELPTASESNLGNIVQYVGATTENYTNGYFYKCVSDGQSPATYSWEQVDVQPNPSETPNKISHAFMYDEDNTRTICNINLKNGATGKLRIKAYEAYYNDEEGQVYTGSELFNIDVFLDDARNLIDGNSGNSMCLFSKLENVGYLSCDICGTYDGYYQLVTQCYGGFEPDEKKYSIFEIEYSDGVDSFDFSAEETSYIDIPTGYVGLNPTFCRDSFPDFFGGAESGGIMPVIESGGTMTWVKYPFSDLSTAWDNRILVTENGGFAPKWASQIYDMTIPEERPSRYLDPVAIFQYLGETDQDYTQGYFYKIAAVGQRNATVISTSGGVLGNITIDQDKFADFLKSQGIYWNSSDYWRMVGDSYNVRWEFMGVTYTKSELEDIVGISYSGGAGNGDYIEIGWDDATFVWEQVNVQPSSGGGSTALSLTLPSANWVNNSITVIASGVTASNNVIVSPAPASQSAYTSSGVLCTAQSTDSLTFTCTQTPSVDLTVTALII